jgi:hypothetical protein
MYVTMKDAAAAASSDADSVANGDLLVLRPGADGAEEVSRTQVTGRVFGSPVGYNGKVYLQTDKKLYAFGKVGRNAGLKAAPAETAWPKPGPAAQLQAIPYEVLLRPVRPNRSACACSMPTVYRGRERRPQVPEVGAVHSAHRAGQGHAQGFVQRGGPTGRRRRSDGQRGPVQGHPQGA